MNGRQLFVEAFKFAPVLILAPAFLFFFLRSLLQFQAVSLNAEPILFSRFEFCMHSLVLRAFSVFS